MENSQNSLNTVDSSNNNSESEVQKQKAGYRQHASPVNIACSMFM